MKIKTLTLGPLQTNCYIAMDETTCRAVVIDPADNPGEILNALAAMGGKVKYVILTHGHFDHMGAAEQLLSKTGARLVCHVKEAGSLSSPTMNLSASFGTPPITLAPDITVEEGEEIAFGESSLKVIHTPGHTVGGMSLFAPGVVFSGDTLFYRIIGRSDFPGGDFETLISSIKNKLFLLPEDTTVYSGHGPASTIGGEKRENFYVR